MQPFASIAMLALSAGAVCGSIIQPPAVPNVVHTNATLYPEGTLPGGTDAVGRVYDEWTAPPSVLNGLFTTGGQEIADDLSMLPVGAGWLDNLGFAVANNAPAGSGRILTGGQMRVAFYRQSNGSVITSIGGFTGFTTNLPVLNLAAGGSTRLSFGVGALKGLGWYFDTPNIFASLTWVTAIGTGGFSIADAGMQLRNSGAIGTSVDGLVGVGPGPNPTGPFGFNGTPYADSAWFIDVDSVPTPGTLGLLAFGGLLGVRRRRA